MACKSMRSPIAAGLLLSLGGLASAAGPARAADPGSYNWTGCYIGVNAGWIGGTGQVVTYPGPSTPFPPVTNSFPSQESAGFTGGAQSGCNWQSARSPLMLGVELDFNGSGLGESTTIMTADFPSVPQLDAHLETVTRSVDWFSTIRGRLGLAQDRWLVYATAGLAISHIHSSFKLNETVFVASDSRTRYGWVGGGGLEYAFGSNWSAKVEYLYLDFGKYTYDAPHATADQSWKVDVDAQEHVVRAGLNYKF